MLKSFLEPFVSKLKLEPDEKIVLEVHRHWFIFLIEALGILLAAVTPLLLILFANLSSNITISVLSFQLMLFLYIVWLTVIWIYFFLTWTDYYLDVWIITNKRIIDIDQKGIFNREVSNFYFHRIQDVTVKIKGFLPTLINYGNIHVQTAGEHERFIIYHASNPYKVKEVILQATLDDWNNISDSAKQKLKQGF